MQKLLTISFLSTKLFALLCFSAMGLASLEVVEAKSPCHGDIVVVSEEENKDDCDACTIAVDAWDQELVDVSEIELLDIVISQTSVFTEIGDSVILIAGMYDVYYPPPRAIHKAAFYFPNKSIVLLV